VASYLLARLLGCLYSGIQVKQYGNAYHDEAKEYYSHPVTDILRYI
jgi:hypothetical protein